MKIIADFHIHSKYSRAVSRDMNLETLDAWAKKKGIQVMGTGDFTHPQWFNEIKSLLEPAEPGLLKLKNVEHSVFNNNIQTRFILTAEISSIYSKGGKVRRVHNIIFAPSLEAAEKINATLSLVGNLKSDGRPILGLDAKKLFQIILSIDSRCVLVPAHAWTPWFSLFGSMSGFDSIEECFEELSPHIFAIETGLSSDPGMNWRLSKLDKISLISNSDAHSPQKISREANVFNCELSYDGIIDAIKSRDPQKFLFTIEFFPEEGKYHYDGHRAHNISMSPEETKKNNGLCPVCHKPLTIGVMNRVAQLADRPAFVDLPAGEAGTSAGKPSEGRIPFRHLIPLDEIIADVLGVGTSSKAVKKEYDKLIKFFGNEFKILIDADYKSLSKISSAGIGQGIINVREGKVELIPGYDGEYGKIRIWREEKKNGSQTRLF